MYLLSIDEIQAGMMLARDIVGLDTVFLSKGTILSEGHILGIRRLSISDVYVVTNNTPDEDDNNSLPIFKADEKLNNVYKEGIDTFKNMYETIGLGNSIEVQVVQKNILPLVKEFLTSNNIMGKLRQVIINDDYIYKHSLNVCIISTIIGKWLNFSSSELEKLSIAAMLHDIGKSKIPASILNKPGKLSAAEFDIMKKHTTEGYNIIKNSKGISYESCLGVLQHHERVDGSGYPLSLKQDKIHEFAKIISVADIFDAMTSERVYKEKVCPFKVAELITQNSFGSLDPYITYVFLHNLAHYYVGNIVKLNSGEIGEIVLLNKQVPTRPLVRVENKYIDLMRQLDYEIIELIA